MLLFQLLNWKCNAHIAIISPCNQWLCLFCSPVQREQAGAHNPLEPTCASNWGKCCMYCLYSADPVYGWQWHAPHDAVWGDSCMASSWWQVAEYPLPPLWLAQHPLPVRYSKKHTAADTMSVCSVHCYITIHNQSEQWSIIFHLGIKLLLRAMSQSSLPSVAVNGISSCGQKKKKYFHQQML